MQRTSRFLPTDPYIPSTYFSVGGTPQADFDAEEAVGTPIPSHHSPLFKVNGEESVRLGVEATVVALKDLLQVIANRAGSSVWEMNTDTDHWVLF